ncbi:type I-E CRISPR-associated protein Cse2/CasB [Streptacidiphilus sp. MAP5-3]|uniref:type I-E CRISPR-associated protein Cse2/CasB n=1 Tax=unclassified Streptacidiphilus TaxID=2643834 RepID=UPI00351148DA
MSTESPPASAVVDRLAVQRGFVLHVHQKCGDPGGRAAIRSALTDLARPYRAYEYVLARIPRQASHASERAHLLVAALYAEQAPNPRLGEEAAPPRQLTRPDPADGWRNLGWSLNRAVDTKVMQAKTAQDRLSLLARQDTAGIEAQTAALVRFLRGQDVPVTWPTLLHDLIRWDRWPEDTARAWMRSYYQTTTEPSKEN